MSDKSPLVKVREEKHVLIPVIAEDLTVVKKDINRKISKITLKYLRDQRLITSMQYQVYKLATDEPNERFPMVENAVVKYVNGRLIEFYERL